MSNKDNKVAGDFWVYEKREGKDIAVIIPGKLIDFCSKKLGFRMSVDYTGSYTLVRVEQNSIISEARPEDIKQAVKGFLIANNHVDVWHSFAATNFVNPNFTHMLDKLFVESFNVSQRDKAYFFYQNGVLEVSKNGTRLILYEDFEGMVWKEQIKKRPFISDKIGIEEAIFNKFLYNLSDGDAERHTSLLSIIGYLLHPFKDPAFTKAVILQDRNVDFSGASHGGTGKSLIVTALSHITSMVWKDGKQHNMNAAFANDDIRPFHRLLAYDDVKSSFNFEEFFPLITGSLKVTRKYKDSQTLPFELTPKLLITSNFMIKGAGNSSERRRIEFEVAPYYSLDRTPRDEFGHNFFSDWYEQEWSRFDNFMLYQVFNYINNGVIMPTAVNLIENRLKVNTDPDFVEFMDANVDPETRYNKASLFEDFKKAIPGQRNLSSITFKKWIDEWAAARAYIASHTKSNGDAILIVTREE